MIDGTTLAATRLTWDHLDDDEKATIHLAAFTNTADLSKLNGWPKTKPLATAPGNSMHTETAKAVEILAARWHRETKTS